MKVQCNKAKNCPAAIKCWHAVPHERSGLCEVGLCVIDGKDADAKCVAVEKEKNTEKKCCDCLIWNQGGPCGGKKNAENCYDFIPVDWEKHNYISGEWIRRDDLHAKEE